MAEPSKLLGWLYKARPLQPTVAGMQRVHRARTSRDGNGPSTPAYQQRPELYGLDAALAVGPLDYADALAAKTPSIGVGDGKREIHCDGGINRTSACGEDVATDQRSTRLSRDDPSEFAPHLADLNFGQGTGGAAGKNRSRQYPTDRLTEAEGIPTY